MIKNNFVFIFILNKNEQNCNFHGKIMVNFSYFTYIFSQLVWLKYRIGTDATLLIFR